MNSLISVNYDARKFRNALLSMYVHKTGPRSLKAHLHHVNLPSRKLLQITTFDDILIIKIYYVL